MDRELCWPRSRRRLPREVDSGPGGLLGSRSWRSQPFGTRDRARVEVRDAIVIGETVNDPLARVVIER